MNAGRWVCASVAVSFLVVAAAGPWLPHVCAGSLLVSLGLAAMGTSHSGHVASTTLALSLLLIVACSATLLCYCVTWNYGKHWTVSVAPVTVFPLPAFPVSSVRPH